MDVEVTSVSRRTEMLTEAASAIQVATGDDIRRSGAMRLPEALRLVSNLQVAQIDSRQWAVASRGFNNTTTNKLLVQLDGRTLYTPLFAGVFWDVQDTLLVDLDRIEVISGPGATQWGSNAVNGVINITTQSARDTQGGFLKAVAGNEMRSASARYGASFGSGAFFRVYGKHTAAEDSITPAGLDGEDAWRMTQGGFRGDWERETADRFTLQGDVYRGRVRQPINADIEMKGGNLLGRWTRTFAPQDSLVVQSYYDYTQRLIPGSFAEDLEIYDLDLQRNFPVGPNHRLVFGGNYRFMRDYAKPGPSFSFLPGRVTREWYSAFVQDEIKLLRDRLRLTAGLKVEHNPYTGTEYQPSARAAWKLDARRLAWAAISRALRSPSRIDREFFSPATAPFGAIAGGPNFKSEELLAYEIGFRAEVRPGFSFSLSTFLHDYDDLRSLEPSKVAGGPSLIANGITGLSYGAELSVDYRTTERWRLRFGYTEQRVSSKAKPGSLDTTSVRSQVLDPKHYASLHSQFDLSARTALDVSVRQVGRIANQAVPAYVEADVRLSWRPADAVELAITGKNLFDRSHPEFRDAATRREIERSFNGSVTWRF